MIVLVYIIVHCPGIFRSGESPSNSMDAVNNIPHTIENDSDFEVENELPPLESIYPKDVYKKLRPKDRKRLEVINGKICLIF